MPAVISKKDTKKDLLKGTKTVKSKSTKKVKKPLVLDFSDTVQMANLLGMDPVLFDPANKKPNYTKDDFLSSKRISEALNIDKQIIEEEMFKFYKRSTPFKVNQNTLPVITLDRNVHHDTGHRMRVHPLAMPIFMESLGKRLIQLTAVAAKDKSNQGR